MRLHGKNKGGGRLTVCSQPRLYRCAIAACAPVRTLETTVRRRGRPAIFGPLHEGVDVRSTPPAPDDAVVFQLDDWQRRALGRVCKWMRYGPQRQLKPGPDSLQHISISVTSQDGLVRLRGLSRYALNAFDLRNRLSSPILYSRSLVALHWERELCSQDLHYCHQRQLKAAPNSLQVSRDLTVLLWQ